MSSQRSSGGRNQQRSAEGRSPDGRTPKGRLAEGRPRRSAARRSAPRSARRRPWPRWVWGLSLGAAVSLVAAAVGLFGLWTWGQAAPTGQGFTALHIAEAATLEDIGQELSQAELVDSAWKFTLHARVFGSGQSLEPGAHWVSRARSPRELTQLLSRRQNRATQTVTLPEGWDSFQIAQRLATAGICSAEAFLAAAHDAELASTAVGQASFEGYLYPATYELRENSEPTQVAVRFAKEARERLASILQTSTAELARRQLSAHEAIILASVVQKEAANLAEMPLVASVFFNRLTDPLFRPLRMLQSDPTAGYGCKLPDAPGSCTDYSGRITPGLLRDASNRYNTYKHPGLPPGPIGNPSAEALRAVLGAPASSYYFFVAGGDGKHRFSKSLEEHQRATPR